jgi:hypothetical protein
MEPSSGGFCFGGRIIPAQKSPQSLVGRGPSANHQHLYRTPSAPAGLVVCGGDWRAQFGDPGTTALRAGEWLVRVASCRLRKDDSRPGAGIQGRKQDFRLPALDLRVSGMRKRVSDDESRNRPYKAKTPPERGCRRNEVGYCLRRKKPRLARPSARSASEAGSGIRLPLMQAWALLQ